MCMYTYVGKIKSKINVNTIVSCPSLCPSVRPSARPCLLTFWQTQIQIRNSDRRTPNRLGGRCSPASLPSPSCHFILPASHSPCLLPFRSGSCCKYFQKPLAHVLMNDVLMWQQLTNPPDTQSVCVCVCLGACVSVYVYWYYSIL